MITRTKQGADNVVAFLQKEGYKADAIHGDKSQNIRLKILEDFKNKNIDILVATDVASRGIDIPQLPFVINYDIPNRSEEHTSELQSRPHLVCRLLLEKKKKQIINSIN